eukprot:3857822-Ditylum_brightwellii.AAC.1
MSSLKMALAVPILMPEYARCLNKRLNSVYPIQANPRPEVGPTQDFLGLKLQDQDVEGTLPADVVSLSRHSRFDLMEPYMEVEFESRDLHSDGPPGSTGNQRWSVTVGWSYSQPAALPPGSTIKEPLPKEPPPRNHHQGITN